MGQFKIPPLDQEFCQYLVCWPNGEEWQAILRGLLTKPAQGRFWDASTGNIKDAQAYFQEALDDNLRVSEREVFMACAGQENFDSFLNQMDIISEALTEIQGVEEQKLAVLSALVGAVQGIEGTNVEISNSQSTQVSLQSQANALAQATAASQSLLFSDITVTNFNSLIPQSIAPGYGDDIAPEPGEAPVYGFEPELIQFGVLAGDENDQVCLVANKLYDQAVLFIGAIEYYFRFWVLGGPVAPALDALVSVYEWAIRKLPEEVYLVVPKQAMLYVAAALVGLQQRSEAQVEFDNMQSWLLANRQLIVDQLYCVRETTTDIWEGSAVMEEFFGNAQQLGVAEAAFLSVFFGGHMLAALWYRPQGVTAPLPANAFACNSCGS